MLTKVEGVNASTARQDMAAPHSIIPSGYDRRSAQLSSEVNAAVKQCHAVPITITIWRGRHSRIQVSTLENDSGTNKVGWCATNKFFNQERSAPVSVLHWRSRMLTRKAGSPQLVETYAANSAVAWIKALWESMTWKDFEISHAAEIQSTSQNHDAACDPQRKSSLLRS